MASSVLLYDVSRPLERWLSVELERRGCNVRSTHTFPDREPEDDPLVLVERGRGSVPPCGARVLQVDWSANPDALREVAEHPGPDLQGSPHARVLLVDDDESLRELLRFELEAEGYVIGEADDGRVALARLADFFPDLVLLDLAMPRFDGCVVLAALADRAIPRPAVILHSAYSGNLQVPVPVAAVLTKPVRLAKLRATLRQVLAARASG